MSLPSNGRCSLQAESPSRCVNKEVGVTKKDVGKKQKKKLKMAEENSRDPPNPGPKR